MNISNFLATPKFELCAQATMIGIFFSNKSVILSANIVKGYRKMLFFCNSDLFLKDRWITWKTQQQKLLEKIMEITWLKT